MVPLGPPTNLKARPTRFIGRGSDLAALRARLAAEAMVTMLGPPGVGKTRLAHEHARRCAADYPGGTWVCDLADAVGVDDICAVVGAALNVPLTGGDGASMVSQLADAIAARGRLLLVLDNLEHVVAHTPATLARFRERAPDARFLSISRVRTELEGESLFDLGPLSVPETDADADASEAVQLFVDRAREAVHDYALTPDEAPRVTALVRELDGLPLALELAAARLRVFSTAKLLESMGHRLDLLVKAPRATHGRHASLRGAIEASWRSLDAAEQAALAQCSVFRGGFDLHAAERVLALGEGAPQVADVLQSLIDQSMLVHDRTQGDRFTLYMSIRDFAWERLCDARGADSATARHAAHYLAEGGAWAAKADGGDAIEARRWLAAEAENLRAVHKRELERAPAGRAHVAGAAEAALALQPLLIARGPIPQCLSLLDPILEAGARTGIEAPLEARLHAARAEAYRVMGKLAESLSEAEAACSIAEAAPATHAAALVTAAYVDYQMGRIDRMRAQFERARAVAGDGDHRVEARALGLLSLAEVLAGNAASGRALAQRALRIQREIGDVWHLARYEAYLAMAEGELGNTDASVAHGERAAAMCRAVGHRRGEGVALLNLGIAELDRDHFSAAALRFGEAIEVFQAIGVGGHDVDYARIYLGATHFLTGRLREARAELEQVLHAVDDADIPAAGLAQRWLGCVDAAEGRVDEARAAFDAAAQSRTDRLEVDDRSMTVFRGHLDLALAREAAAAGDHGGAAAHQAAARARLDQPCSPRPPFYIRIARRSLSRALELYAPTVSTEALVVHREGDWFLLPPGQRVGCGRRRVLRRLLLALTAHRLRAPGEPLPPEALVAKAWPGEKMLKAAAISRLQVALSALRKMGLRDLLQSHPRGYRLDPNVEVRFAEAGEGGID